MTSISRDRPFQRALDVIVVLLALPIALPLMGLISIWIRLDGSGSVIHTQTRAGRGGHEFSIHKFRTLYAKSEGGATVASENDPRITRPGKFLRPWRLDELPQLFDVLRGVMSLVGPRPERPEHLSGIPTALCRTIQSVRPGLTGPAAIEFLAEDRFLNGVADPVGTYCRILLPEKLRIEEQYVLHGSLGSYLRILGITLVRVFSTSARRRSLETMQRLAAAPVRERLAERKND